MTVHRAAALSAALSLVLVTAACDLETRSPLDDTLTGPTAEPTASPTASSVEPAVSLFVDGLLGASGSTLGPDGALYVTQGAIGEISRVEPAIGDLTTLASGLPPSIIGIGGVVDVAFLDGTAYALVTLVSDPFFPTGQVNGVYRVDGPSTFTVIADIGAYNLAHPPATDFFLATGVQYAMEAYRGGLLVTDGHHNRVLWISLDGQITEFQTFGNIVPTGLEVWGHTVLMAEAGPVPHLPEDGRVVSFGPKSSGATEVASGAELLVDVEFGLGRSLYALSQGDWDGVMDGSPALPYTGSLVRVDGEGGFDVVVDELNIPTSMEFIGNTAYVVGLAGEIWKIEHVGSAPHGRP